MNPRQIALLSSALLCLVWLLPVVSAEPSKANPNVRAGDTVAAKWSDGTYYIATVTGTDGGKYSVLYGDGDKGTVDATGIIPIPADAVINVGDHVLACWKGARMYPGFVTAKTDQAYTVKWDDGDVPLDVARGKVVALPQEGDGSSLKP
jgi:hypothetical protein